MRTVAAAIVAIAVSGCASLTQGRLKADTAARTGCAEQDVKIVKEGGGFGYHTWTAECAGKTFHCKESPADPTVCTAAITPAP